MGGGKMPVPKSDGTRKFFRVDRHISIKLINMFNQHYCIDDIRVNYEDDSFLIDYRYEDSPKKDESDDRRDFGFDYNHVIQVHPTALIDFINALDEDPFVSDILVVEINGTLKVVYYYGSNDNSPA